MNFFKTAFFADEKPEEEGEEEEETEQKSAEGVTRVSDRNEESAEGLWSFGGLVKTLQSKSGEVIQSYRRDLEDFRSGLHKETEVIREVASRAVKDFPNTFEIGASVAQESLESVGQAIDDFGSTVWQGTTGIIAEGKDLISKLDEDKENLAIDQSSGRTESAYFNGGAKYSRLDAQIRAMQMDSNSYCQEPEDNKDFEAWLSGFKIEDREEEIENLCRENRFMDEVKQRLVPSVVDYETFWARYFYRVFKIKQAEEARVSLVKRAINSQEEEEDFRWEFDDEEEAEGKVDLSKNEKGKEQEKELVEDDTGNVVGEHPSGEINASEKSCERVSSAAESAKDAQTEKDVVQATESFEDLVTETKEKEFEDKEMRGRLENNAGRIVANSDTNQIAVDGKKLGDETGNKSDTVKAKMDNAESTKGNGISVASSKPSLSEEEDDLEWDDIEDMNLVEEKKFDSAHSPGRADIRKKLAANAEEEDEDLSWD
eukprot:TRINITY_DN1629_c0_g1_i1.p1 TRINITY_DN1629_c0_g1~~TRINITY_DN1629_c0_g1_i1.p1  ORF type:complete len:486 (+),score=128.13 TRINITY_DN1629_c0_g1_i1:338-1795(+)